MVRTLSVIPSLVVLAATVSLAGAQQGARGQGDNGEGAPARPYANAPDVLNCGELRWLDNCETINRQAKQNPGSPIRINGPDGLEFNFAPDTPSVVIEHTLNPSKESAAALVDYYDAIGERYKKAASLARDEIIDRGGRAARHAKVLEQRLQNGRPGSPGISINDSSSASINPDNVRVFVFYKPSCPVCKRFMPKVASVQERNPDLVISGLQLEDNAGYREKVAEQYGIPVKTLSTEERQRYKGHVDTVPTVWVQDENSSETRVVEGDVSSARLEQLIAEVSQ